MQITSSYAAANARSSELTAVICKKSLSSSSSTIPAVGKSLYVPPENPAISEKLFHFASAATRSFKSFPSLMYNLKKIKHLHQYFDLGLT